ncbi:unnamed protein product [Adineta steineri]|uniref:polynucleotide adenylyltransferase n=2 Tax=Adineta steineri TaxID=433720 RepID=A0A818G9N3_9BILA|nr:unnamed protein product [Adineta steineri]CAF3485368.1 unnamed protein product [Adineta steineri]
MEQKLNLSEGMYRFDQSIHQWILCPCISLISDDLKNSCTDDMYISKHCQFITWNIHSDLIFTNFRYQAILKTLQTLIPDIICLQEVTFDFLNLLLNEIWLQDNNYYIIIMGTIFDHNQKQSYGQLMLTKNFHARAFSICPLYLSDDSSSIKQQEAKKYIIARFGLNLEVTIDLVNLHLYNADEKRCQALEYFFKTMNMQNYMLIGDFNFGDNHIKEQHLLEKYQYQIHDLWKDIYDIEENPGYTFDTSQSQASHRFDRYLLHLLQNLSYSIEHLNMVGLDTILIDSINNKRMNQSDHFGLQLILNFQIRTISDCSALAVVPTINMEPLIELVREQCDSLSNRWPIQINLFWPFFDLTNTQDDNEEIILLPLRLLLAQFESFDIEINEIDFSIENHTILMPLNFQSTKYIKQLHAQIKQLFSQCLCKTIDDNYNPYLTTGQFDGQVKSKLTLTNSIQFPVRYISILQKLTSFHVIYQLPLGSVLEPIGLNQFGNINCDLEEFFNHMNLYENKKSYEQKQEKFQRLSICFEEIFNKNTLHCFTCAFLPYGSFRLGLNGEDLDTVLVLSQQKSLENKTNLDQTFLRLRYQLPELTNLILDLLEKQIHHVFNNEIIDCRNIQAIYPILSILFNDHTRVEIFVQIKEVSILDEIDLLSNFHEPIHGVHDIERLIIYVRYPIIFQYFLTFIRTWAQHTGIYGQVYGYLGGFSWAILCAYICHKFLSLNTYSFSLEQFFILIQKFFSIYSQFNWIYESLCLSTKTHYSDPANVDNRGSMRILCPSPPFNNTSRSTINSTRNLIIENFQYVHNIIEKTKNYNDTLKEILQLSNQFPNKTIQSILQLTLCGQTISELHQWVGYMKSRLAHFLTDCEEDCELFVQTDTKIEIRKKNLERYYSIGFQVNEQILSRHRQFYYSLNKFLDQFKLCSFRSDTMKFSYKLMSINDWNNQRTQI